MKIDAYAGWSELGLKRRCRQLVRAVTKRDLLIASIVEMSPQSLLHLSPELREEARKIHAAYDDPIHF